MITLDFALPAGLEAHEPPEARGRAVRLLVGRRIGGEVEVVNRAFTALADYLEPGDVLVVNTSATVPAALPTDNGLIVHVSTERPDGTWLVELRRPAGGPGKGTARYPGGEAGQRLTVNGGGTVTLVRDYNGRLWVAALDLGPSVAEYLIARGRPIRYGYVPREWPISAYQTVFGMDPGSAEMPSAGRPFTETMVQGLRDKGIRLAPVRLHTGVASAEANEAPYAERFAVGAATAELVNQARGAGHRIVAVGTTAVRAIESAAGIDGLVRPASGWTDLVITTQRGVRVVGGLVTGLHEPRTSHLWMLEAIAGPELLSACYAEAVRERYLWHEFGDSNLLLP